MTQLELFEEIAKHEPIVGLELKRVTGTGCSAHTK